MNTFCKLKAGLVLLLAGLTWTADGQPTEFNGGLLLQTVTGLNGSGVRVAQVEADYPSTGDFEVNPPQAQFAGGSFTYYSSSGSSSSFPNSAGSESVHADDVGQYFYGVFWGVATNVVHIDNYDASDFVTEAEFLGNYTVTLPVSNINDPVVNQSFIFSSAPVGLQTASDTAYDNYAAQYGTLFVSGAGNGGTVSPPSTSYNGLSVAAYGGSSSTGPTADNGRAKPDLTANADETSFSTPQVAGAAVVLIQAGLRGDGGADTNSATRNFTLKALLLNGAVKPPDWTNNSPSPLSPNYGAGRLNVFNSYEELAGGKHGLSIVTTVATGGAHPPAGVAAAVPVLTGWDCNTNTSSSSSDAINHYYFNVTNAQGAATFLTRATLVWNRHQNQSAINHLNLYLYNMANSNLVALSTSAVDNVQHLWVPRLPAGRYDLQVWKAGGSTVSAAEPYALAYTFAAVPLTVATAAGNVTVSWPVYPADGFMLASTTNLLSAGAWNTNYPAPSVVQGQNEIVLGTTNTPVFFRLVLP